jgi:hypothetical protein
MHARCTTLQEMKAHKCERPTCQFAPMFQVFDVNSHGLHESIYLCKDHYADLQHEQTAAQAKQYCELCGNPDTKFYDSPKFGDANPNKIYQVCAGCKQEQEDLTQAEFEAQEEEPAPDEVDDRPNLDPTPYDEF